MDGKKKKLILPKGQRLKMQQRLNETERLANNGEAILSRFPEIQKFLDNKIFRNDGSLPPVQVAAKKLVVNVAVGALFNQLIKTLTK